MSEIGNTIRQPGKKVKEQIYRLERAESKRFTNIPWQKQKAEVFWIVREYVNINQDIVGENMFGMTAIYLLPLEEKSFKYIMLTSC